MSIEIAIIVLILMVIFGLIQKLSKNDTDTDHKNDLIEPKEAISDNEKYVDYSEMYFSELKNGQKSCMLMSIYDESDLMFAKIFLHSVEIPYFIKNEHTFSLYIGYYYNKEHI